MMTDMTTRSRDVRTFDSLDALSEAAADEIVRLARESVRLPICTACMDIWKSPGRAGFRDQRGPYTSRMA